MIKADFTNIVHEYIENGFQINFDTMTDKQGEITKVDLVKQSQIIRVRIESDYDRKTYEDLYLLIVEKFNYKPFGILWNDKGELIEKKKYASGIINNFKKAVLS